MSTKLINPTSMTLYCDNK